MNITYADKNWIANITIFRRLLSLRKGGYLTYIITVAKQANEEKIKKYEEKIKSLNKLKPIIFSLQLFMSPIGMKE